MFKVGICAIVICAFYADAACSMIRIRQEFSGEIINLSYGKLTVNLYSFNEASLDDGSVLHAGPFKLAAGLSLLEKVNVAPECHVIVVSSSLSSARDNKVRWSRDSFEARATQIDWKPGFNRFVNLAPPGREATINVAHEDLIYKAQWIIPENCMGKAVSEDVSVVLRAKTTRSRETIFDRIKGL